MALSVGSNGCFRSVRRVAGRDGRVARATHCRRSLRFRSVGRRGGRVARATHYSAARRFLLACLRPDAQDSPCAFENFDRHSCVQRRTAHRGDAAPRERRAPGVFAARLGDRVDRLRQQFLGRHGRFGPRRRRDSGLRADQSNRPGARHNLRFRRDKPERVHSIVNSPGAAIRRGNPTCLRLDSAP